MCGPHQVWPLRSECCGRGVPTKVVCAECMKMCCLGGKNSVVKGLTRQCLIELTIPKLGGEELPLNAVHPLPPVDVKFRLLEIHLCLHREVTYGTILLFYVAG